jgi:hypothetical protein
MGAGMRILEDAYAEEFALVGIHTGLEDYALAYALNENLKLRLRRVNTDLCFTSSVSYPFFEWKDELYDQTWSLLTNTCITEQKSFTGDLFPEEPSFSNHHLVPEHKGVNFLLKADEDVLNNETLRKIKAIPGVLTAYVIETANLKSKPNLIF